MSNNLHHPENTNEKASAAREEGVAAREKTPATREEDAAARETSAANEAGAAAREATGVREATATRKTSDTRKATTRVASARSKATAIRDAAAAQLARFDDGLAHLFRFIPTPIARATAWLAAAICHVSTILWLVPFIALAVLFIFLARQNLLICSTEALNQVVKVICLGILVALFREPILNALDGLGRSKDARTHLAGLVIELLRAIVALAICTICAVVAIETPWNEGALSVSVEHILIDVTFIGSVMLIAYFLGQRRGVMPAIWLVALFALGIGQAFVAEFRGAALLPTDLLALSTAAEVSAGYTYTVTDPMLTAASALGVGLIACCLIRPATPAPGRVRIIRPIANITLGILCLVTLQNAFSGIDLTKDYGINTDVWNPISSYHADGLVPHFLSMVQRMAIDMPAGYSDDVALEDEQTLASLYQNAKSDSYPYTQAQFADTKPSVICVMNETFSDLSMLDGLGIGYTGPAYFNSIDDALVRGELEVSAYGGGTCNSEFEFMTGATLGYIGNAKYPYTLYDLSDVDNLVTQFADMGYDTTAIHPCAPTNWKRNIVYRAFGFDRFLSAEDFAGAPEFHSGVTDAATYESVLDRLRSNEAPQFILDVTIQNHSGYDQNNIDESLLPGYTFPFAEDDAALTSQLNEYLACINASDRDLQWFMEELRNLDRPVMLVFFGDHQPGVSGYANDALFAEDVGTAHGARAYRTNYFVWTNYEVAGAGDMRWEDASSSTLGALALDAIGAPLTDFQKAQLGARMYMPMINMFAYKDNEGGWHSVTDATPSQKASNGDGGDGSSGDDAPTPDNESWAAAAESCRLLQNVQYLEFAKRVS